MISITLRTVKTLFTIAGRPVTVSDRVSIKIAYGTVDITFTGTIKFGNTFQGEDYLMVHADESYWPMLRKLGYEPELNGFFTTLESSQITLLSED